MTTAAVLFQAQCYLGEGPLWHAERKSIFWVDIEAGIFYEYHWESKAAEQRTLPMAVSVVVKARDGKVILGVEGGLLRYDLRGNQYDRLLDIETDKTNHRTNDGKVDCMGRLWMGTLHRDFIAGRGTLYSVQADLLIQARLPGLSISNGMAWSADEQYFYFIDSPTYTIKRFKFDAATGDIRDAEIIIRVDENMGSPDGMCIDREGMLWIAHWGGFCVRRWNPETGLVISTINLPVPNVSSCCFAGENLDYLVITTAQQGLSPEQLRLYPQSGDVFLASPGVTGTVTHTCSI